MNNWAAFQHHRLSRTFAVCKPFAVLFLTGLLIPAVAAADLPWPCKSGPTQDGRAAEAEARGVPTTWDEASGKNIAWKIPLEGNGHSSPVIGNGRVWLTAATPDGKRQFVYCIDAANGNVLHHRLLFENPSPEPLGNPLNTYASPTCVLENDALYAHFGTYGTARLDPETADVVWERRDINCRHFRGPGSSPAIVDDVLVLTLDGIDQQYLTALDKHTGKTLWRTDRSTDYGDLGPDGKPHRDGDLRKAFSTPAFVEVAGRTQVISVGSRAAFGYDLQSGEELWTITHDDYNAAAQPLFIGNSVLLNTGGRNADLYAVRLDATTRGRVNASHVEWHRGKGNARLPWPVLVGERLLMVTDNGVAYRINAKTGEEVWAGRLGGTFVSSPVVANGLVYITDEDGRVSVFGTGEEFQLVARNQLSEGMRASPAIAGGALYLRTLGHLYKIAATAD